MEEFQHRLDIFTKNLGCLIGFLLCAWMLLPHLLFRPLPMLVGFAILVLLQMLWLRRHFTPTRTLAIISWMLCIQAAIGKSIQLGQAWSQTPVGDRGDGLIAFVWVVVAFHLRYCWFQPTPPLTLYAVVLALESQFPLPRAPTILRSMLIGEGIGALIDSPTPTLTVPVVVQRLRWIRVLSMVVFGGSMVVWGLFPPSTIPINIMLRCLFGVGITTWVQRNPTMILPYFGAIWCSWCLVSNCIQLLQVYSRSQHTPLETDILLVISGLWAIFSACVRLLIPSHWSRCALYGILMLKTLLLPNDWTEWGRLPFAQSVALALLVGNQCGDWMSKIEFSTPILPPMRHIDWMHRWLALVVGILGVLAFGVPGARIPMLFCVLGASSVLVALRWIRLDHHHVGQAWCSLSALARIAHNVSVDREMFEVSPLPQWLSVFLWCINGCVALALTINGLHPMYRATWAIITTLGVATLPDNFTMVGRTTYTLGTGTALLLGNWMPTLLTDPKVEETQFRQSMENIRYYSLYMCGLHCIHWILTPSMWLIRALWIVAILLGRAGCGWTMRQKDIIRARRIVGWGWCGVLLVFVVLIHGSVRTGWVRFDARTSLHIMGVWALWGIGTTFLCLANFANIPIDMAIVTLGVATLPAETFAIDRTTNVLGFVSSMVLGHMVGTRLRPRLMLTKPQPMEISLQSPVRKLFVGIMSLLLVVGVAIPSARWAIFVSNAILGLFFWRWPTNATLRSFGNHFVGIGALGFVVFNVVLRTTNAIPRMTTEAFQAGAVIWCLIFIALNLGGMEGRTRALYAMVVVMGLLAMPNEFSDSGTTDAVLLAVAGMLVGEMLGAVATHVLRSAYHERNAEKQRHAKVEAQSQEELQSIWDHASDWMLLYDPVSQRMVRTSASIVAHIGCEEFDASQLTLRADGTTVTPHRCQLRHANGAHRWFHVCGNVMPNGCYLLTLWNIDAEIQALTATVLPSTQRSHLLASVMDTPSDPQIDHLCELVQQYFKAPIVLVTLLDERRQWFWTNIGLGCSETPLEQAFCRYAIRGDDVLVVLDATQDERFRANPLVTTDPKIRFYAGAPIKVENVRVGTLCVIDTTARDECTSAQRGMLQTFAKQVTLCLRMRRLQVVTKHTFDVFGQLKEAAIEYDWANHAMVRVNEAWVELMGYDSVSDAMTITFQDVAHPDDQALAKEHVKPTHIERFRCRVHRKDRRVIWVEISGIVSADGRHMVLFQSVENEMALERANTELHSIWEHSSDLIFLYDWAKHQLVRISATYHTIMGYEATDEPTFTFHTFVHPDDQANTMAHIDGTTGGWGASPIGFEPTSHRVRFRHKDGTYRWFEARGKVLANGCHLVTARCVCDHELELEKKTEELQTIWEHSNDAIVLNDFENDTVLRTSRAFQRLLGYGADEEITFASIVHPEDFPVVLAAIDGTIISSHRVRCRHKDGTYRWFESNGRILPNGQHLVTARNIEATVVLEQAEAQRPTEHRSPREFDGTHLVNRLGQLRMYAERTLGEWTRRTATNDDQPMRRDDPRWVFHQVHRLFEEHPSIPAVVESLSCLWDAFTNERTLKGYAKLRQASDQFINVVNACVATVELDTKTLMASSDVLVGQTHARNAEQRRVIDEKTDELNRLVQSMPGMAYTYHESSDGTPSFTRVSERCFDIYGLTPEEMYATDFSFVVDPEPFVASIAVSKEQLSEWDLTFAIRHTDGDIRWIHARSLPNRDADGGTTWTGVVLDVTKQHSQQISLEKVSNILRDVGMGLIVTAGAEDNCRVEYVNPSWEALTGYTAAEVVGNEGGSKFLQGPETNEARLNEVRAAIRDRRSYQCDIINYKKDGTRFWNTMTIIPMKDGRFVGTVRDVTEQVERERRLNRRVRRASRTLNQFVQTANAPIFGLDTDLEVTMWNPAMEALTGYTQSQAQQVSFIKTFVSPTQGTSFDTNLTTTNVWAEALNGKPTENYKLRLRARNGGTHTLLLNATPQFDPDGTVVGVVGVGQDVTEENEMRMESHVMASELRQLVDTANAPIFGIDKEGRVNEWNEKTVEITGFEN